MPKVEDEYDSSDESDIGSIDGRDLRDATLPEPEPVQEKLSSLLRRYRLGQVNLNPYYQRAVVWPPERQSGLINSIFNNYYVPPVIFQCRREPNPKLGGRPILWQTAIDGKQRITSILAFFAGQIPYRDPRGKKYWYPVQEAKHKGRLLTAEMKDRFDNSTLLCIEYVGLNPKQEEDLFARVQQGMALSNYEKQMASHTPWTKLTKEIMKSYPNIAGLCSDLKRGKDFGNVANVIAMIHYYDRRPNEDTLALQVSQAKVSSLINRGDHGPPSPKFSARIRLVFKVWDDLYKKDSKVFSNTWHTTKLRKFSPIEFVASGILIHVWLDKRDNNALLTDLTAMRNHVRSSSVGLIDLRTNSTTWPYFWDFIADLERKRGTSELPTKSTRVIPRAVELDPHNHGMTVPKEQLLLSSGPILPATDKRKTPAQKTATKDAAPTTTERTNNTNNGRARDKQVTESPAARNATVKTSKPPEHQRSKRKDVSTEPSIPQTMPRAGSEQDVSQKDEEPDDPIFTNAPALPMQNGAVFTAPQQQQQLQQQPMQMPGFAPLTPEMIQMYHNLAVQAQQQQQQQQQQQPQPTQGMMQMPQFAQYPMPGQQQQQPTQQQPLGYAQPMTMPARWHGEYATQQQQQALQGGSATPVVAAAASQSPAPRASSVGSNGNNNNNVNGDARRNKRIKIDLGDD